MIENTHRKIARKIAEELNLVEKDKRLLELGSIDPDNWGQWHHHREREQTILEKIFSARKKFLERDDECYYDLGVALHFLEDCWTLSSRSRDRHTKYEYELDKVKIMNFEQLISNVRSATIPEKAINTYSRLIQNLRIVSQEGIEQWYDGIWQYGWNTSSLYSEPRVTIG
jgi:hypothetical protein